MALNEVILPRTSDAMSEALLSSWLVEDGQQVNAGDLLAEVETDKAMVEVAAEAEGLVVRAAAAGTSVEVGAVLAYIVSGDEAEAFLSGNLHIPGVAASIAEPAQAQAPVEMPEDAAASIGSEKPESVPESQGPIKSPTVASPLARKLAKEAGLRLDDLAPGSGPGGRIVRADVEAVKSSGWKPISIEQTQEKQKPSARQMAMASAMVESVTTIPHFSVTRGIDPGPFMEFRRQLKNIGATPPSFSTLFVMALARAMEQSPWARRTWTDDGVIQHGHSAIGVAVAEGDSDLVVPIVHGAEAKSLDQVSAELDALIGRAKARRLNPEELSGGIGTISNLGMFGIDSLTPIIPPGQSFILGLGQVRERDASQVSRDGASTYSLTVTLSGDHRVLTGVGAALLLRSFAEACANPVTLIQELRRVT